MKIKLIIMSSLFILTGCQATAPIMKNSISFEMDNKYWPAHSIVYKNNWPECRNLAGTPDTIKKQRYITTYSSCKVSPEGYVPPQIIIEYAPWLTYEEQQKIPELKGKKVIITGDRVTPYGITKDAFIGKDENALKYNTTILKKNIESAIDKLPPTAWKRIVLTPLKDVEKYKYQVPEGKGNARRGKEIHYTISLKPDGSYSIETKLYWVQKYQLNWN
ncbi:hypothetical protein E0H83_09165 [Acinetobacter terrestris]|uniref:hypothetical protein n=1 Tax=Acinetobacter terrestris TaxID=2529843 RepID=UPI001039CD96|nr:hypothetical protein [Acinetobacter terrestris]TCB44228.1 hypothetical protein E0H83_09165 [Acinetobacter terrestris]